MTGNQQARRGDGEIERKRMKAQRKAWRARCVLQSPKRRKRMLLLCWLGAPVERLQSELNYRDQVGKILMDVVYQDELNPFWVCKVRLSQMSQSGPTGPLKVGAPRTLSETFPLAFLANLRSRELRPQGP